jgi:RecA-family ATPase
MNEAAPFTTERYSPPVASADDYSKTLSFDPNGHIHPDKADTAPKLHIVAAASFAGVDVPVRRWLVPDLIPSATVTMLSGDGGVGKSLLAIQLGVSVAAGRNGWIGVLPEAGPVLYVSAEDDLEEIHRRLEDVVTGHDVALTDLADFHIVPLAGKDAVLAAPGKGGVITPTLLWTAIVDVTAKFLPKLVILDNLADIFAGNENARPEARQFIGMLRGLAIEHSLAVLVIAHPSLSGLSSGTGTSGSTAWSNSVRSRLYLDRARSEEGTEPDPNVRVLRTMKANYSAIGGEIRIRWENGCFRPDGAASGFDRLAADVAADALFLDLVAKFQADGRDISASPSANFAPVIFSKHPASKGMSAKILRTAMDRLFAAGQIKVDTFGPPSRQRTRLILATEKGEK